MKENWKKKIGTFKLNFVLVISPNYLLLLTTFRPHVSCILGQFIIALTEHLPASVKWVFFSISAPEVLNFEMTHWGADMWSVGVLLYIL